MGHLKNIYHWKSSISKKTKSNSSVSFVFAFCNSQMSRRTDNTSFTCSNITKCFIVLLVDIFSLISVSPLKQRWESVNSLMPLLLVLSLALDLTVAHLKIKLFLLRFWWWGRWSQELVLQANDEIMVLGFARCLEWCLPLPWISSKSPCTYLYCWLDNFLFASEQPK